MGTRNGSVRQYIWGALGVIAILAGAAWWAFGNGLYFAGEPRGRASCSGCSPNGCSASAASWGELGRKISGNGKTFSKQGEGQ